MSATSLLVAIAGLCGLAVVYPYLLYPLILKMLPIRAITRGRADAGDGSRFSLLFCAYNEAAAMPSKLDNLAALKARHPALKVLAFDDGSNDGTPDMISKQAPFVHLVRGGGRNGKAHGMKLLSASAETDFLIFTDANVLVDAGALDALAASFEDPSVGGICGALRYVGGSESSTASVGGLYWRLEETIKDLESATGSVIGADGSIFAVRRTLYPEFPDFVLDDFTVSMECVFQGYRLVKSNDVVAYERLVSERADEFSRKIRIASRAFTTHRYLRPKRRGLTPFDKFKYMSHKTIRWFGGAFLILGFAAVVAAVSIVSPVASLALLATSAAFVGFGYRFRRGYLSSCLEIVIAMIATAVGVGRALRGRTQVTWDPAKSRDSS